MHFAVYSVETYIKKSTPTSSPIPGENHAPTLVSAVRRSFLGFDQ